jgi:hypothetical protein
MFLQQPDPGASPPWAAKWERGFSSLATDLESGKIHNTVKQHTVVRFSQSGRILYTKVIAFGQVSVYVFVHHNLGQGLTHWRDEMQSLETRLEATQAVLERYRTTQSIQLALRDLITMKMDGSQIRDSVELRKRYMMLMARLPPDLSCSPNKRLSPPTICPASTGSPSRTHWNFESFPRGTSDSLKKEQRMPLHIIMV